MGRGGQGGVAELGPGDGLFIPHHWWHHVHSAEGNTKSISLNFWFDPSAELGPHATTKLSQPPSTAMHCQLAKQAEELLVGCTVRAALARSCPRSFSKITL